MISDNKRILIVVTEGPTDEEFYKRVINYTKAKNKCKKFNFNEIKYMCADGIGNLHRKMLAKFKIEICNNSEYSKYEKIVCFCYDKDDFKKTNTNPPINRDKMKKDFYDCGASKIIEIVADDMIEDFFLIDIQGIIKLLKLGKKYKIPQKESLDLLKQMYKDGNKIYSKGTKAEGLVDALNMDIILSKICCQLSLLCMELGYCCNNKIC